MDWCWVWWIYSFFSWISSTYYADYIVCSARSSTVLSTTSCDCTSNTIFFTGAELGVTSRSEFYWNDKSFPGEYVTTSKYIPHRPRNKSIRSWTTSPDGNIPCNITYPIIQHKSDVIRICSATTATTINIPATLPNTISISILTTSIPATTTTHLPTIQSVTTGLHTPRTRSSLLLNGYQSVQSGSTTPIPSNPSYSTSHRQQSLSARCCAWRYHYKRLWMESVIVSCFNLLLQPFESVFC